MSELLELLDYRRRVAALYAEVREERHRDHAAAHAHWRAVRDQLFGAHPRSPLPAGARDGFFGLSYYGYDPSLAFSAPVDTGVEPERYEIATSTGAAMAFVRFGRVRLPVGDLDVFWLDAYGGGLFLPFRDGTAGDGTYGGGRYLLDTAKGADLGSTPSGELICDFNFSYHPSCHYDAAYSCPLAPPGNHLAARVEAGERAWPGAGSPAG
ncbi:MAG: DUF1684 domain-containing protein [Euzebyales bacterium]|nr:DUF1684 domain-containing protein [Euzebyales bacterium]